MRMIRQFLSAPLVPPVVDLVLALMLVGSVSYSLGRDNPTGWHATQSGALQCVAWADQMTCALTEQAAAVAQDQATAALRVSDDQQRRECIALAVFTEARGEPTVGQAAVAQTVLNRASNRHQHECEVVTDAAQFQGIEHLTADPWLIDQGAWDRALHIATAVAQGSYNTGACRRASHFHGAMAALPDWANKLREVCRVGAHRFYARSST